MFQGRIKKRAEAEAQVHGIELGYRFSAILSLPTRYADRLRKAFFDVIIDAIAARESINFGLFTLRVMTHKSRKHTKGFMLGENRRNMYKLVLTLTKTGKAYFEQLTKDNYGD